ncbi:Protein N-terminal glutamine amidohydrolase [Amphibalanus amphitrite]|uniref:Protein N-terminal glutamine amidohydrolase n=1 Tax=Amphibalanus amphitrite TaxID=1232801 RepID=A0A6A4XAH7_AMPAM|nr:protein N-terminal glutamine amidohydrolase-like isoform X2 [Amphibalanus amphitrite]XP_043218911.1 protein N-terminal glutamine amidohydrolase-like isoform X2 [Amphibalanus amphitrite]XP_043218912.1 protein N-terminal glutamine amidohydrolase-like isoform X2 [Amphibalanus amphitrite]XP_043218913.1 protein N-terminal glutamine amidohydrolase-like isoform X2 [Amphibalanus amphitrite]XP_043218914.1 protein N-terminal glutamine amidohydrolase-like isoform X2 [Amphibalanus amphitrite]XP_0432222
MAMESPERQKIKAILPPAKECTHTLHYCEENVWLLCQHVQDKYPQELPYCYAVFISNQNQTVPLWRQRAGRTEDRVVIWDYHVIFMYQPDSRCLVYDMDSELPFPTYFHKYVTETFRTDQILHPEHHRFFRVVPATEFLSTFASDRSHMKREGGVWASPPPPYPPISTPGGSTNNLQTFISMDGRVGVGEVLNLSGFVDKFYRNLVNI